ncbi:MAG: hypothetical protein HC781_20710 [Leptolyngbyaceae cyanobacterium CSU_1_4]|nr:hypothetical protein [Leptolyngbyaceae cyanobacterium CSU_1_4]
MDQMKRGRGRPRKERESKTVSLSVNPESWQALQDRAIQLGFSSRSELVDAIGSGLVELSQVHQLGESLAS